MWHPFPLRLRMEKRRGSEVGRLLSASVQGFSLGHNTDLGLYEVLGHHPKRGTRFVNAMSGFANRSGIDTLANAFDWTSVRTVVDVGGGRGEVSIALAERFEHLHFTVQDLEHVVKENALKEAGELDERVKFVHHDYFAPQSVSGADVYYFRYIFHNLPDASCVKLLKAQIPGKCILLGLICWVLMRDGSIETRSACHHSGRCCA